MTEQEKNEKQFIIMSALVILVIAVTSGFIWRWTTEPMKPMVVEQGDHTTVRWGSRLYPFEYVAVGEFGGLLDGAEKETLSIPGIGLFRIENGHLLQAIQNDISEKSSYGWQSISELPPDAYRRHFEGQVILEKYREKQKSAASKAADGPAITER